MSKITFRADEDLVERIESLDASKSEIMRDALRSYLERADAPVPSGDDAREEAIEALLAEGLASGARDVNITIALETEPGAVRVEQDGASEPAPRRGRDSRCGQCGETVSANHVYCPNCGEKRSRRVFCECGDELRSDWAFCPSCGRRTPAADVLDRS